MAFRTPHKCGWILRSHPHLQYPAWRRNARRVPSCLQWRCCDASCDEFATLELSIFFRFMWKPLGTPTKTVYIYIQYIYICFFLWCSFPFVKCFLFHLFVHQIFSPLQWEENGLISCKHAIVSTIHTPLFDSIFMAGGYGNVGSIYLYQSIYMHITNIQHILIL